MTNASVESEYFYVNFTKCDNISVFVDLNFEASVISLPTDLSTRNGSIYGCSVLQRIKATDELNDTNLPKLVFVNCTTRAKYICDIPSKLLNYYYYCT